MGTEYKSRHYPVDEHANPYWMEGINPILPNRHFPKERVSQPFKGHGLKLTRRKIQRKLNMVMTNQQRRNPLTKDGKPIAGGRKRKKMTYSL